VTTNVCVLKTVTKLVVAVSITLLVVLELTKPMEVEPLMVVVELRMEVRVVEILVTGLPEAQVVVKVVIEQGLEAAQTAIPAPKALHLLPNGHGDSFPLGQFQTPREPEPTGAQYEPAAKLPQKETSSKPASH